MAGITFADLVRQKIKRHTTKSAELGEHADKNPLEAKVGGTITIDTRADRDLFYVVGAIEHAVEVVGRREFSFTDYVLVATPADDDERADDSGRVRRLLRIYPVEEQDSILKHNCVVLEQYYEADYETVTADNLYVHNFRPRVGVPYPALQDPNGGFRDNESGIEFKRRFGDLDPHQVTYTILKDDDRDGRVEEEEIETRQVQYWDYEEVGGETDRKHFTFATQDENGMFRLFRGRQVSQELVIRL